jgi:hypothetical protein
MASGPPLAGGPDAAKGGLILPAVLGDDLLHPPLDRDRLPGLDLDVVRLPSKPPQSWWMRSFAFGSAIRFPLSPAASSSAPSDIAIPTQVVVTRSSFLGPG